MLKKNIPENLLHRSDYKKTLLTPSEFLLARDVISRALHDHLVIDELVFRKRCGVDVLLVADLNFPQVVYVAKNQDLGNAMLSLVSRLKEKCSLWIIILRRNRVFFTLADYPEEKK